MIDSWNTFPVQMGEHRAFISYNHGYAEAAATDKRDVLLKVRLKIRMPTAVGMPTQEESSALISADESLDKQVTENGGVYVGRVTVDGYRYFHYYVGFSEDVAERIVEQAGAATSYDLRYIYRLDPGKESYWKELFPTNDDWQVIQDIKVLESLRREGDQASKVREVAHWAYFPEHGQAMAYSEWAKSMNYKVSSVAPSPDRKQVGVRFSHDGTMALDDITHHTTRLNRKAREFGGEYDGWETSVER